MSIFERDLKVALDRSNSYILSFTMHDIGTDIRLLESLTSSNQCGALADGWLTAYIFQSHSHAAPARGPQAGY